MDRFIRADWSVPADVFAATTTRLGPGASLPPFDAFNLGDHVGDDPVAVAAHRTGLRDVFDLPGEPFWLRQVHGVAVADADATQRAVAPEADAAVTRRAGTVLAVLTADCVPVVLSSDDGAVLGVAHAGWRGLASGVLERTVSAMAVEPARLSVWIGPCIRQPAFEVGPEVRAAFCDGDPAAETAFVRSDRPGHFHADLAALVRRRLGAVGVRQIADCGLCTYADARRFYSHRRDARTGRLATLVWRTPQR